MHQPRSDPVATVLVLRPGRAREHMRWRTMLSGAVLVSLLGVGHAWFTLPRVAALDLPAGAAEFRETARIG